MLRIISARKANAKEVSRYGNGSGHAGENQARTDKARECGHERAQYHAQNHQADGEGPAEMSETTQIVCPECDGMFCAITRITPHRRSVASRRGAPAPLMAVRR